MQQTLHHGERNFSPLAPACTQAFSSPGGAAPSNFPDTASRSLDPIDYSSGVFPSARASIASFLAEDLGRGDVTTAAVVPERTGVRGRLLAKSATVVAGLDVAQIAFSLLDSGLQWNREVAEGTDVEAGRTLATLAGDARAILAAERVALNLVQRMCGIATATRAFVRAVEGTNCQVLDTRKTAPGLRVFDKRAVALGGARNHRFGLDDGILIKDNHLAIAGSVAAAVARARRSAPPGMKVEVEVEDARALEEALEAGADAILLDNRSPAEIASLAATARRLRPGVTLEASGGITLDNVRAYAGTGVDFVSVGALTHSVVAADISLELDPA